MLSEFLWHELEFYTITQLTFFVWILNILWLIQIKNKQLHANRQEIFGKLFIIAVW